MMMIDYDIRTIEQHVSEMKETANFLAEYSWPKTSMIDERHIICLKQREVIIDGYDVVLHFSVNNYDMHTMHTFQIYSRYSSFLPFSLTCKVAEKFLGKEAIYYLSIIQQDRKIYIFSQCIGRDGNYVMDNTYQSCKKDSYMGFNFNRVLHIDKSKFF